MSVERLIIIDGYNVIYASKSLKQWMPDHKERAREKLFEYVKAIHSIESVRMVLVFDSSNETLEVEYPFRDKSFECVFAPASVTADGVIERLLVRAKDKAKDKDASFVTVVSNDNLVREATRSNGALVIRPDDLFDWVALCDRRLMELSKKRTTEGEKPFGNRIDFEL